MALWSFYGFINRSIPVNDDVSLFYPSLPNVFVGEASQMGNIFFVCALLQLVPISAQAGGRCAFVEVQRLEIFLSLFVCVYSCTDLL